MIVYTPEYWVQLATDLEGGERSMREIVIDARRMLDVTGDKSRESSRAFVHVLAAVHRALCAEDDDNGELTALWKVKPS